MSDPILPVSTSRDASAAERALATPVFDPLWMLGRQWQTGELHAEDAGSAVGVEIAYETTGITELETPAQIVVGAGPGTGPLQLGVDAEPPLPLTDRPLDELAAAGLELLRTLDDHGAEDARPAFLDAEHRLTVEAAEWELLEPATRTRLRPWRDRVPDPRLVVAELIDSLGPTGAGPGPLPARPGLDGRALLRQTERALREWLRWLDPEPPAGTSCWVDERLESTFTLTAATGSERVRLRAPEHLGGELDWHAFVRSDTPLIAREPALPSLRVLPAPIRYAGMPLPRFWELEDGNVNLDLYAAQRGDIGAQALLAFVHQHADDWLSVPLELPVGSIAYLRSVQVLTTFGERITIPATAELDGRDAPWQLFSVSPEHDPAGVQPALVGPLVLVHSAGRHLTSAVTEHVLLLRDEMANLAWAVELQTRDRGGLAVDRFARHQRLRPAETERAQHGSRYRLGSTVPDYWYPLEAARDAAGRPVLALSTLPTEVGDAGVQGTILDHRPGAAIRDEEVGREGAHVTRRWHRARWLDGTTHTWLARAKQTGLGEGSSGLRFDYLEQPQVPPPEPASVAGFAGEVLADSPLAYFRLRELAATPIAADASGNENHATVPPTGIVFGASGLGADVTAARLEGVGNARIVVPDRGRLAPDRLTLEALVAWAGPTGEIQQRILERSADDQGFAASYGLSLLPTGHVRVELTTTDAQPMLTSASALVPHAPTHLAATYDGSTLALYIDGTVDAVAPLSGAVAASASPSDLGIGNQAQSSRERAFNGVIDDVAVYDHALSDHRIRAHVTAVAGQLGNLVRNPSFALARPAAPPPVTGTGGGPAAADDWYLWNNSDVTSVSELVPTTRPGGSGNMLRVTTTGGSCGLYQAWAPVDTGPATATVAVWIFLVHGTLMTGAGNGGNTGGDIAIDTRGQWQRVEVPSGRSPVNEMIVYAKDPAGAEYFVDEVSVRP